MVFNQQKDAGKGYSQMSSSDYLVHFIVELKFNIGDKYDYKCIECVLTNLDNIRIIVFEKKM